MENKDFFKNLIKSEIECLHEQIEALEKRKDYLEEIIQASYYPGDDDTKSSK